MSLVVFEVLFHQIIFFLDTIFRRHVLRMRCIPPNIFLSSSSFAVLL